MNGGCGVRLGRTGPASSVVSVGAGVVVITRAVAVGAWVMAVSGLTHQMTSRTHRAIAISRQGPKKNLALVMLRHLYSDYFLAAVH
jgi:hypothetical protein